MCLLPHNAQVNRPCLILFKVLRKAKGQTQEKECQAASEFALRHLAAGEGLHETAKAWVPAVNQSVRSKLEIRVWRQKKEVQGKKGMSQNWWIDIGNKKIF